MPPSSETVQAFVTTSSSRGPWWKGTTWLVKRNCVVKGDMSSTWLSLLACAPIMLSLNVRSPEAAMWERPLGKTTWRSEEMLPKPHVFQYLLSHLSLPSPGTKYVRKPSSCYQRHYLTVTTWGTPKRTTHLNLELWETIIDCCCFTPLSRHSNWTNLSVCLEHCDVAPLFLSAHLLSVYRPGSYICSCT